jgi:Domain of unknown function (DUF4336)
MLHEVAPGLWVVDRPQRFAGAELGARMTVIRLADGGLFLHSPVALDSELSRELTGLGKVRCVIAPNRMHHLHAHEYAGAFHGAKTFGSPALVKKRRDLHFDGVLGATAAAEWAGQIEQRFFAPVLAEAVFFSPATRTLVVTDLVANIQRAPGALDRLLLRLDGAYRRLAMPRAIAIPLRLGYARIARAAFDEILQWDFDRVIMAHGDIVDRGGREALGRAWSFV